jgi:putative membrane protein
MDVIARFILMLTGNLTAVLLAGYFVPEFQLTTDIQMLMPMVLSLTIANLLIRPLIKLILSPLILVSFGLFSIVINVGILFLVDIYSESLTINGLTPLFYATSIISFTNIVIDYAALFLYRRRELS